MVWGTAWGMALSGVFFLNLLVILLIVGVVMVMLNRAGYTAPKDNERLVKIRKRH